MRKVLLLFFAAIAVSFPHYSNAHPTRPVPISISPTADQLVGTVKDINGAPLPNVTIVVKGTSIGTTTDQNGQFTLPAPAPGARIFISAVGYRTQEIPYNGETTLNIVLQLVTDNMETVVVSTGYQRINKQRLTGAVSTIDSATYQQRINVSGNFINNMEGKIPGLIVNNNSSSAAEAYTIRGVATFSAIRKPLIILNGFPTEIDLNTINPNDVISVDILKDAAAAAIYGARAANGVIVVNTKKGAAGKIKMSAQYITAYRQKNDPADLGLLRGQGYVDINYDLAKNVPIQLFTNLRRKPTPVQQIELDVRNGKITQAQANEALQKLGALDNTSQYSDAFLTNITSNQFNFDISGGSENINYIGSVNYLSAKPGITGYKNERAILNLRTNFKIAKGVSFDFSSIYTNGKTITKTIPDYASLLAYELLRDVNGNPLAATNFGANPYQSISISDSLNTANMNIGLMDLRYYPYNDINDYDNTTTNNALRLQGRLDIQLFRTLSLELGGVYEYATGLNENWRAANSFQVRFLQNIIATRSATTGRAVFNIPIGDILTKTQATAKTYTVRAQLNYQEVYKAMHRLNVIAGVEQRSIGNDNFYTTSFGYNDQSLAASPIDFARFNSAAGDFRPVIGNPINASLPYTNYFGNNEALNRFVSVYGNLIYTLKEKYNLSASARIDQSNLFGTDPKYQYRPNWSVGASWNINKECFLADKNIFNLLILRGTYGFNGNTSTSEGPYTILSVLGSVYTPNTPPSARVLSPENSSLRWEQVANTNIGLDAAILKNRITLSMDYYRKLTRDAISATPSDPTLGFTSLTRNSGKILNKGFEFAVTSQNIVKEHFGWQTNLTVSFNRNKVLANYINNLSTFSYNRIFLEALQGYPLYSIFAYRNAGLSNLGVPMVYNSKDSAVVLASGADIKPEEMVYAGTLTPTHSIGFNNMLRYKSWSLSALLMYYGGHVTRLPAPTPNTANPLRGAENRWKQAGDEANTTIPRITAPFGSPGNYGFEAEYGYLYSDRFVAKANYMVLRDVVLTYRVNPKMYSRIGFTNVELRVQGNNLFRHAFHAKGYDLETMNLRTAALAYKTRPQFAFSILTNF